MRLSDHRDFQHPGMLQQHLFHLARIDVRSPRNDDVLAAVLEREEAGGIQHPDIAGMQPAMAQGAGSGLRIVPVALHHRIAAHQNFADLTGG